MDYLEKEQLAEIKTGESDPSFGASFVFSLHVDELKIAGMCVVVGGGCGVACVCVCVWDNSIRKNNQ